MEGPSRSCPGCGGEQAYQDQHHSLTLLTSVGSITLPQRAAYRCVHCHTSTYPLDERLGVRHAGRTSRYLQELLGWVLAEEPIATATETMEKFLGIRIPVSQMRRVGEALGAAPPAPRPVIHPLRRDTDLGQLQPYARTARLAVIDIAISEGTRAPWLIRMAIPLTALALLTGLARPSPPAAPRQIP